MRSDMAALRRTSLPRFGRRLGQGTSKRQWREN